MRNVDNSSASARKSSTSINHTSLGLMRRCWSHAPHKRSSVPSSFLERIKMKVTSVTGSGERERYKKEEGKSVESGRKVVLHGRQAHKTSVNLHGFGPMFYPPHLSVVPGVTPTSVSTGVWCTRRLSLDLPPLSSLSIERRRRCRRYVSDLSCV